MKRFVRGGRAELCVEDSGTAGPALVCLHAGVADRRMWAPQIDAFASSHRVIAYDRRGFGETRYEAEPFSHVNDLLAVLDDSKIDAAVLMGCSQGGRIALDTTLAHPSRVRALVLVASAVTGAPESTEPDPAHVQAVVDAYERADQRGDTAELNQIECRVWLDGPEAPEGRVQGPLRELFLSMNGIALAAEPTGDAIEAPSAWDRLEEIGVPTLVVWGSLDFPHLRRRLIELARRIPGARSVEMDCVAHLPGLEAPDDFNREVAAFLARLRQAQPERVRLEPFALSLSKGPSRSAQR
jgi:pimeloyl-ACP methyl ester carboxylesterase